MSWPGPPKARQGRALVCIVVCMGIATTITMKSMQTAIRVRRQMVREIQMEQTRWLVQAAGLRAADRLRTDEDYDGEELDISAAVSTYDQATIRIEVTPADNGRHLIAATCRIGTAEHPAATTKRSARWLIDISQNETIQ